MIKEICQEIDNSINAPVDNPKLRELINEVFAHEEDYPSDFVEMCYEVHELDSFTTDESAAKEYNMLTLNKFSDALKNVKEKYIQLWEK